MKLPKVLSIPPFQPERPVLTVRSTREDYQAVWEYDLAEVTQQAAAARQKAEALRARRQQLQAERGARRPMLAGMETTFQVLYEIQPIRGLHIRLCELRAQSLEDLHARMQAAFDLQQVAIAMETIPPTD